jgi:hypothetical protein
MDWNRKSENSEKRQGQILTRQKSINNKLKIMKIKFNHLYYFINVFTFLEKFIVNS